MSFAGTECVPDRDGGSLRRDLVALQRHALPLASVRISLESRGLQRAV